jgi:hypothetical protein
VNLENAIESTKGAKTQPGTGAAKLRCLIKRRGRKGICLRVPLRQPLHCSVHIAHFVEDFSGARRLRRFTSPLLAARLGSWRAGSSHIEAAQTPRSFGGGFAALRPHAQA